MKIARAVVLLLGVSSQRRPSPMSQNVLNRAQSKRSRVDDLGKRCQEALSNLSKP